MIYTPERYAENPSEDGVQAAYFCWLANPQSTINLRLRVPNNPLFDLPFAIPNGGYRNKIAAARMKMTGTKAGVWDVFIPYPSFNYSGMWIEFKYGKNTLSREQKTFQANVGYGYVWLVTTSWEEAALQTLDYLGIQHL